ncbi:hypothetical protein GF323_01730 [Candidatus Woesearchaeota archaeon]|nr:hypothetical protein [Candidatus Woesearchaeota archaeon]
MIYLFTRIFLGPVIELFIGKIEGRENFPEESFIAAANHSSYIDDFIFPYSLAKITDRKFHIFVNSRFYKNWFFKKFLDHYEMIPVYVAKDFTDKQERKRKNAEAFRTAMKYLEKGDNFLIFPEGARSENGKLKKGKVGAAKIALESKAPVLPVGIRGSYEIMPKGAKFPKMKKADIIIGKPINLEEYYEKKKDYKTLEKVTDIIMSEIAKLIH